MLTPATQEDNDLHGLAQKLFVNRKVASMRIIQIVHTAPTLSLQIRSIL